MTLVAASDGLPAREVGLWSEEKLFYIDRYVDIFSTGMKNKWSRRVYVDLFSGPGRCVIKDTGREVDGSALLALNAKSPFSDLYLNDYDPEVTTALQRRVAGSEGRVTIRTLDCNAAARDAVDALELNRKGTIGLAVIDPTAFQISLDSIAALTQGRPVDLIVTLMTGFLKRFIDDPSYEPHLDPFFGSRDWRSMVELKLEGEKITFRKLLDFYEQQLRKLGYTHVDDDVRILNSNEATIYHLVFASKHPRGAEFFKKISQLKFSGQKRML